MHLIKRVPIALVAVAVTACGGNEDAKISNDPLGIPSFVPASATNVREESDSTGRLRLAFSAPEEDLRAMVDTMPALTQQLGRATHPDGGGEAPDVGLYAARSDTGQPLCVFVHWLSRQAMVWHCPEAMVAEEEARKAPAEAPVP